MKVAELLAATEVGAPLTAKRVLLDVMLLIENGAPPVFSIVNVRAKPTPMVVVPKSV